MTVKPNGGRVRELRIFAILAVFALSGCLASFAGRCPVVISWGNYGYVGAQVVSTGGASFLSPSEELFDGLPSTITRLTWTGGTQTTSSKTGIEVLLTRSPKHTTPATVDFGVVMIKNTSLPAGLKVELRLGILSGDLAATGRLEADTAGGTSIVFLLPENISNHGTYVIPVFVNDVDGSTVMGPGEEFTVGEINIGMRADFALKRNVKVTRANASEQNLSAANATFYVWNAQARQEHYDFAPIDQKAAFAANGAEIDFESLITVIMNSEVVGFVPFETLDPALYPTSFNVDGPESARESYRIRARTAFLGRLLQPPITAGGGDKFYNCSMDVQESI
jgi:hypothetical protein